MNEDWINKQRDLSDAELVKGGAEVIKGEDGEEHLAATEEQTEKAKEEMEAFFKKVERMKIIPRNFISEKYIWDLANNEEPENYVYVGRQVLRSAIQTIVENLLKTGEVEKMKPGSNGAYKGYGWGSGVPGCEEYLETKNPEYKEFIYALNDIMKVYEQLDKGSGKIFNAGYDRLKSQTR